VTYLSKVADFNLPHLHLAPLLEMTLFKFCRDLWHQSLCSIVYVIVRLAISVTCDRRTDRWVDTWK